MFALSLLEQEIVTLDMQLSSLRSVHEELLNHSTIDRIRYDASQQKAAYAEAEKQRKIELLQAAEVEVAKLKAKYQAAKQQIQRLEEENERMKVSVACSVSVSSLLIWCVIVF